LPTLEGIDMIFFGPGDFSTRIGDLGIGKNKQLIEAAKKLLKVCIE